MNSAIPLENDLITLNTGKNLEGNDSPGFIFNYSSVFFILNLFLIILCSFYIFFSFSFGKRLILKNYNAKECKDPKVLDMVQRLSKEFNIKMINVFIIDGAPNAFVFGYPISLAISKELIRCLSKKELCMAIRHELAHVNNKDYIIKPILQALRILFFYNPIVHVLYYKMVRERELMADSLFINSKDEKVTLMEALVKIHKYQKQKKLISSTIYDSYTLSLLSNNLNKLEIKDRFNHLFGHNIKKSLISTFICIIILVSNISMVSVAKNVLDTPSQVLAGEEDLSDDLEYENENYSHPIKYVFRVFENYHSDFNKKCIIYFVFLEIHKDHLSYKDLLTTVKSLFKK
jgi:beta-lactamase regulating signal transducer with metallopeptidase domain